MRGEALLVLLLLAVWTCTYSRWFIPKGDESPALLFDRSGQPCVEITLDTGQSGIYQYNDGQPLLSVIKLADKNFPPALFELFSKEPPPVAGEIFIFKKNHDKTMSFQRDWMPASHRLLLGIPLHPDRMTVADWEVLPGIGPKLAAAIELDRQNNGDFLVYTALDRVKGIGAKRLSQWTPYFSPPPHQK